MLGAKRDHEEGRARKGRRRATPGHSDHQRSEGASEAGRESVDAEQRTGARAHGRDDGPERGDETRSRGAGGTARADTNPAGAVGRAAPGPQTTASRQTARRRQTTKRGDREGENGFASKLAGERDAEGDYAAYRALDPFFAVVMKGLSKFVDGEHYFDTLDDDVLFEFRYDFPGWPQVTPAVPTSWRSIRDTVTISGSIAAIRLIAHPSENGRVVTLE